MADRRPDETVKRHGALRLALALTVAASHLGVQFGALHGGVVAVMIFYLLAGMVADKLLSLPALASPRAYWGNRLLRIWPLYIFSLSVAALAWLLGAETGYLARAPSLIDGLANLTIIPLAYYMYTGQDTFTLIPPAWSLAVELQFYLLAPWLLRRPRLLAAAFWLSLALFVCAVTGLLHTEHFGYRLLPGVLFVFLAGSLLHRAGLGNTAARWHLLLLWLALLLLALWLGLYGRRLPYNYETLAALLAGLPLLYLWRSPLPGTLDRLLGALSYGVFLLHFPALWLLETAMTYPPPVAVVLTLSVMLAWIGHRVAERRLTFLSTSPPLNGGFRQWCRGKKGTEEGKKIE